MTTRHRRRFAIATAAVAMVGVGAGGAQAANGPVVLGGDHFPRFGELNTGTGQLTAGWLAMRRSLEYVAPRVGRFNDNSVAAIGARSSASISDDAGAAIGNAAAGLAMPVTYVNGAEQVALFFEDLAKGRVTPRVIWLAGTQSSNGLDSAELGVISANAQRIATFVAGGGGLIAHGDASTYAGWLPLVAPGLGTTGTPGTGLAMTTLGLSVLPGVSNPDISVGTWGTAFTGSADDLGAVAVATGALEPDGLTPQRVVLAGGTAWTSLAPAGLTVTANAPTTVDRGDVVRYDVTVRNTGPNLAGNTLVTHSIPAGWAFGGAATGGGSCAPGPPLTCTLRPIGVGETTRITMLLRALRAGSVATVTTAAGAAPDDNGADNRAVRRTTVRMSKLRVTTTAPAVAAQGQEITVRIAVRNTGTRIAKKVILRSPTPTGFVLERRPPGGRIERGAAVWELGGIAPGRTRVVVFRMRVDTTRPGLRCIPGHARANNVNFTSSRDCVLLQR